MAYKLVACHFNVYVLRLKESLTRHLLRHDPSATTLKASLR